MKELTSIVVGVDFSDCSRSALDHAHRIAAWSSAKVHPVHVIDVAADELAVDAALSVLQRGIRADLIEKAQRQWEAFAEGTPGARELNLDVCITHRLAGIRQELDLHQADLLVLGAYGEGKPNVGLGTLTSGCVRGVPTDVLIVRDTCHAPFRTVVVGIDFSATSQRALEAAALVAHHEGATLYAAHVEPAKVDTYARLRGELGPELESFVKATTSQYPGLEARTKVFPYSGHRSGILEFAALVNADLVAVGARGRTNLRDVVLGSTAEKVVRDSVSAVWVAKPRQ